MREREVNELRAELAEARAAIVRLGTPRLLRNMTVPAVNFVAPVEKMHAWLVESSAAYRETLEKKVNVSVAQTLDEFVPVAGMKRLLFNLKWLTGTNVEVVGLQPGGNGLALRGGDLYAVVTEGRADYTLEAKEWHETLVINADCNSYGGTNVMYSNHNNNVTVHRAYRTVVYKLRAQ